LLSSVTPDPQRVDSLLQLILAVAGQQDEVRDRELGPIHLLKYAYLADLAHAMAKEGEPYTGVRWQFHDFGPWSPAVLDRVEPAALGAGAEKKLIHGGYGDFVRYSLQDEKLLDQLDHKLPGPVVSAVRWSVREFGSDTPSLLRHVYLTPPMLRAAPGEYLTFEMLSQSKEPATRPPSALGVILSGDESPKIARQRRKMADQLRKEVRRRLAERHAPPASVPVPPPRYDAVFFDGVAWLDQQAGEPFPLSRGELVISPDIWKSRGRTESGEDDS
jgi:hypothetical protein